MSARLVSEDITLKLREIFSKGEDYVIGVDIGATNTRVSLATLHGQEILPLCRFVSSSTRHQLPLFESLQRELEPLLKGKAAIGAAIAGAGRILQLGSVLDITNFKGGPEHRILARAELPQLLFPQHSTVFLNDLQAASYGVLSIAEEGSLTDYFSKLWGPSFDVQKRGHYLIVAPGTGLGASALLWIPELNNYIAMPLEGGHTLVPSSGPASSEVAAEQRMLDWIANKCWAGKTTVEFEDLVCGQGVVNIFEYLCSVDRAPFPAECTAQTVVDRVFAASPDPLAVQALYLHYRYMSRFSASLTILTQVAAVFWCGSNQVINDSFIRARATDLERDWFEHSKAEWLREVPVLGQVKDVNVNILGTILIARRQSAKAPPSQAKL